jgi:hypothetical protein
MRGSLIRCLRKRTSIENVVHLLARDPDDERVQRMVLAALWSEPVREPEEVLLVDRVELRERSSLDNPVFEGSDRDGRCRPSAFGMYRRRDGRALYAPLWTRSCRSSRLRSRSAS